METKKFSWEDVGFSKPIWDLSEIELEEKWCQTSRKKKMTLKKRKE